MKHPSRGGRGAHGGGGEVMMIPGPFCKIPPSSPYGGASHVRRLSLDVCATLIKDRIGFVRTVDSPVADVVDGGGISRGLDRAVQSAVVATAEEEYWARLTAMHEAGLN